MNIVKSIKQAFLTEEKSIIIKSPMQGHIFNLEQVANKTFASKIIGDGLAIIPTGNTIVSPCSGRIGKIFKTSIYSFNIMTTDGLEVVITIGEGFNNCDQEAIKCFVNEKQKIAVGEPVLELNISTLRNQLITTICLIVLPNAERVTKIQKFSGFVEPGIDKIMKVYFI